MSTFRALRDNEIESLNPTFNYGKANAPAVGETTVKSDQIFRSLFYFDISTFVGTVGSASLALHISTAASAAKASHVYRLTQTFTEGTGSGSATGDGATWNTYDGVHNWTTAGGDFTTTDGVAFNAPTSTGVFTITGLGTLAQDAITSRSGILMILLKFDSEASNTNVSFTFDAKEAGVPTEPVLTVLASGRSAARSYGLVI